MWQEQCDLNTRIRGAKMERNLNLICTNNGKAYFDGFYYNGKLLIEVEQLYEYGFSCHNCSQSFDCDIYKESIACKCDLRRKHKSNIETIGDNMSRVDGRMVCEFYELKRPTDFDSIKKFPEFQEKESKFSFDILDSLFSCQDLYVGILNTSNAVISSIDFLNNEIRRNFEKSEKRLKESEDFIKFFKAEIPDVYKKLREEFNRVKENK